MLIDSAWTIGAIASKKASSASPVRPWMAVASGCEVRGPVATITLSHSAGGSPAISPNSTVTFGCARTAAVTASENATRSTASAPPAGSLWASAMRMISEPQRRISSCSNPTALCSWSSERKELEHTSSAKPPVRWASVSFCGRISWMMTLAPASAACQAASEPARPAPMIWMGEEVMAGL